MLPHIEYRHCDIECVRHKVNRHIRLKDPEKNVVSFKLMEVILLCDHCDQLITKHERDDQTGYGHDHRLGQILDEVKNPCVPSLRCLPYLTGNRSHLIIDLHEHPFQTILDHPDKDLLDGFRDSFDNGVHPLPH